MKELSQYEVNLVGGASFVTDIFNKINTVVDIPARAAGSYVGATAGFLAVKSFDAAANVAGTVYNDFTSLVDSVF